MKKIRLNWWFEGEGGEGAVTATAQTTENTTTQTTEGGENNNTPPARPSLKELLKGDYKDEYKALRDGENAKFNRQIDRLSKENDGYRKIATALSERYGIDGADSEAILKALTDDRSYLRDEAMKHGVTEEQLEEMNRLRAGRFEMDRAKSQAQAERDFAAKMKTWRGQAEEVQESYPDFDFDTEMRDRRFYDLLKRGNTVKEAYIILHHDSMMNDVVGVVATQVKDSVLADIRANGIRPLEGAAASAPSIDAKTVNADAKTPEGRKKLLERAANGETIRL